jgi:hypothetical protein
MRDQVARLVLFGRLPNEDVGDESFWEPWEAAVPALTQPATDDGAAAVLDVGSRGRARYRPQIAGVLHLTGSPLLGHDLAMVASAS